MLDIPPNVEQAIIAQAEQQGVTVNELLSNMFTQQPHNGEMMLNTQNTDFLHINDEQYQFLLNLLDDDTPANDELKALLGGA